MFVLLPKAHGDEKVLVNTAHIADVTTRPASGRTLIRMTHGADMEVGVNFRDFIALLETHGAPVYRL